ncbi:hypothetical protein FZC33_21850 [Labrys sp. KNU-23]|uniref:hypothetical protein n=1 Tax=Labrys sp. KNU-23 TaxID=2789216 RepID=UPI0011EF7CC3|nr:hypothetical protein [Labrys sp. KNU-23]QEN88781.1 hypothetical protein FZC33_21850 [Labrys sp. KNU-23]
MSLRIISRILLPLALLLGLATRPAAAQEIPLVSDPEIQARDYVAALTRQDFDGVVRIACAGKGTPDCAFGRAVRDALIPLKGHKLIEVGKALDLSFPEAIREIYYAVRIDNSTPVYIRFTYQMSDDGWRHRTLRYASGSSGAIFPTAFLEGSLVGLTGANRAGPATAVDELSEKIIAGLTKRDFEGAAAAVRQNMSNLDDTWKRSVDTFFGQLKAYDLSHIRKIIDKEMGGFRQQFFYAAVTEQNTMFIRLTYVEVYGQWRINDLQFIGEGNGMIPTDILTNTIATLPNG